MSKFNYKYQKKCRLCDNKNLSTVINLNKTPLANSFLKKKELKKKKNIIHLK